MPHKVLTFLNNVHLKINLMNKTYTIHLQQQHSNFIQMSTELKMRSLRFLVIWSLKLTKLSQNPERQT
jgi:hypothetical protein